MIASGEPVSQIAAELHLSVTTIGTHRAWILDKRHLTTPAVPAHFAYQNLLGD